MARMTKTTKAQLTARAIFWAFDWERRARVALDASAEANEAGDTLRTTALFAEYKNCAKWRDEEMVNAFGMTWQAYHDFAFKPNGKLADVTTKTLRGAKLIVTA